MTAFVYLLWHATEPRFKIGKALNISNRAKQLGGAQFDFGRSKALRLADCTEAHRLERTLHRAFHAYRIPPGNAAPTQYPTLRGAKQDGDTEWFSATCWERLRLFLEQTQDLFEYSWESSEAVQAYGAAAIASAAEKTVTATGRRPSKARARRYILPDAGAYARSQHQRRISLKMSELNDVERGLKAIRSLSKFVAVVQTGVGFSLVGETLIKNRPQVQVALEKLLPILEDRNLATTPKTGHFFKLDLRGQPGQDADNAPDIETWFERLAWQQTPAIPGFDLELRVAEMAQATHILRNTFGILRNHRGFST
jgi:hypothetical protein